ncbi:hypothetical protein ACFE04_008616 [Oxalis oulophora]
MKHDRLSNLPEEILMHILLFMETKHAIQTSVLSKQWPRLWTKLPNLYINADSFHDLVSFVYFLKDIVRRYANREIYSCTFVCKEEGMDCRILNEIIKYAFIKKVKCLQIQCPSMTDPAPPQIFSSERLVTLSLEGLTNKFPAPYHGVSIRSIRLNRVIIENDIVMYCPNLEKFFMTESTVRDLSKIVISAPKLVKLDLQFECLDDNPPEEMLVHIDAPIMESLCLHFRCDSYVNLSLDKCPTLLEYAWIDIYGDLFIEKTDVFRRKRCAMSLVKCLKDHISAVRSLTFSSGTLKVLYEFPELVKNLTSPFHNLKSLELCKDEGNQPAVIPPDVERFLVAGSPNSFEISRGLRAKETPE